jgi:hypothetical protein
MRLRSSENEGSRRDSSGYKQAHLWHELDEVVNQYLAGGTRVAKSTVEIIEVCLSSQDISVCVVVLMGCLPDESEVASACQGLETH